MQVFCTISLDNLVPLGASPMSDPFLDDGEQERSDHWSGDTAISRRLMARNRSALMRTMSKYPEYEVVQCKTDPKANMKLSSAH